jgi:type IV pilus assembly protein PilX
MTIKKIICVQNILKSQQGVVLIVALVVLILISFLAIFSLRNAKTSEMISSNVRQREMAIQAAELALRYCEDALMQIVDNAITLPSVPVIQEFRAPSLGLTLANWDVARTGIFVLPLNAMNRSDMATYLRAPECIIERSPADGGSGVMILDKNFLVTARGFGPDVPAGITTPSGSEAWLQSDIGI